MTTTLTDDFGRKTIFTGAQLVDETTDTEDESKPQWLEVTVWRTEAGNFVVRRATHYRIIHASRNCSRAEGYVLVEAGDDDTYNCKTCNAHGDMYTEGFAQAPRISVDVYTTPSELTESFRTDGRYTNFSRSLLSELAKQDAGIDDVWSVVHVA